MSAADRLAIAAINTLKSSPWTSFLYTAFGRRETICLAANKYEIAIWQNKEYFVREIL